VKVSQISSAFANSLLTNNQKKHENSCLMQHPSVSKYSFDLPSMKKTKPTFAQLENMTAEAKPIAVSDLEIIEVKSQ
jgi:hypothetical protein